MHNLEYTYSRLSASSVVHLVTAHYDIPAHISGKFYALGLHDNYLLESGNSKFIFRVYRNDWRSRDEVYFELDLLAFLRRKTSPVAFPLPTKSGELALFIDSPEGKRAAALFQYAEGHAPGNKLSAEESQLLGSAVANIHCATESFATTYIRPVLDVPYLLDDSIAAVEPFIDAEGQMYLESLQNKIHRDLPALPQDTQHYGICIGDVNLSNFHINDKQDITLFDFDQCGFGYRAFEVGKFFSSIHSLKQKHQIADAFLDGYRQVRRLTQNELDAIPYFEVISIIWVMAIHAYNAERIGRKWLEKPFWDRHLATLKEMHSLLST